MPPGNPAAADGLPPEAAAPRRGGRFSSTGFTGSALVRLLVRLTDLDVPPSSQGFADRVSQWLGWADAISLSAALSSAPGGESASLSATGAEGPVGDGEPAGEPAREHRRVRTTLTRTISDGNDCAEDFASHRRACFIRQQDMETSIAPLRGRLRRALAARSPALAQLAAVDAVMEQALAARERSLLSAVPLLLQTRFEQLRQAGDCAGNAGSGAWLDGFRDDMRSVLLAELDLRLQPCEGLLAALHAR